MLAPTLLALAAAVLTLPALAQPAAPSPMRTRFAASLDPEHPLPEHPRPLLQRDNWQSLNGLWDYSISTAPGEGGAEPPGPPMEWNERAICVPFPIESALSGVQKRLAPNQTLWYRRTFNADELIFRDPNPAPHQATRLLLHFGAVDYQATVYLNGHEVGSHTGGYDPFTLDLTDHLAPDDPQELIVRVQDPTDTSTQPRGKQTLNPHGIWYTAVSGIWQTVWLEPVNRTSVLDLGYAVSPDLQWVQFRYSVDHPLEGDEIRFTLTDRDGRTVGSTTNADRTVSIAIAEPHPWSPDDPYLYSLTAEITRAGQVIDTVHSYLALRTVELKLAPDGYPRIHLNGEPIFILGLLDQGWWPDGLYTAPTDDALRSDIEATLAMGFNAARKHVKVEPQRWYYWADRLGLLVLQDMPSGDGFIGPADPDLTRTQHSASTFREHLGDMIRDLRSHPSIIAWIPFNEGWGQFQTNDVLHWTMTNDPTRIVGGPSGWTDRGVGHLIDAHVYPGPGMLPPQLPDEATGTPARASFLGEFGGLGLTIPEHTWKLDGSWGYRSLPDAATLERDYAQLIERLRPLQSRGLAGAIYTQTTDVEIEVNGLLTYDRLPKLPFERLAAINARAFLPPPIIHDITTTAETADPAASTWRYTTSDPGLHPRQDAPDLPEWFDPAYADTAWPTGPAGFGTRGTPGAIVRTEWNTPSIWLRRAFDLPPDLAATLQSAEFINTPTLTLRLHHDEDVQVYLNGTLIHQAAGYQTGYIDIPLDPAALRLLKPTGNLLALHCTQTRGGQYLDAALSLVIDPAPPR